MAGPRITVTCEVADGARVAPDARLGPFCTIGPEAVVGPRTVLGARVTVNGGSFLGSDNVIGDNCVLGTVPQDLKYGGQRTYLIVGDRNRFGPGATAQLGTEPGGYLTRIGNDNVLEANAHVAHDCYVDDGAYLGPLVLLAGHVRVEDGAVIEESSGAHHFTTIGAYSRVGSRTPVRRDVPPFTFFTSFGLYTSPPAPRGADEQGMDRAGLDEPAKDRVRRAVRHLFQDEQALAVKIEELLSRPDLIQPVRRLCESCRQSLSGKFGRYRERFRGQMPPEARRHLPPELLAGIDPKEGRP